MKLANKNLPPPNATLHRLIKFFQRQGLDKVDLVALSGIVLAHLNAQFFSQTHRKTECHCIKKIEKHYTKCHTTKRHMHTHTPTTNASTDIFNAKK